MVRYSTGIWKPDYLVFDLLTIWKPDLGIYCCTFSEYMLSFKTHPTQCPALKKQKAVYSWDMNIDYLNTGNIFILYFLSSDIE